MINSAGELELEVGRAEVDECPRRFGNAFEMIDGSAATQMIRYTGKESAHGIYLLLFLDLTFWGYFSFQLYLSWRRF